MKYRVTDNQQWRKERLLKVEKVAAKFLNMTVDQLRKHVVFLSDEKGQLFVVWEGEAPTDFQRQCFSNAWWVCGEKEDFVQHTVVSNPSEQVL